MSYIVVMYWVMIFDVYWELVGEFVFIDILRGLGIYDLYFEKLLKT